MQDRILACLGAFVCAALTTAAAQAAEPAAPPGKQWALLVGVEKYHRVPTLEHTVDDVLQLSATLRTRGGYAADRILSLTDKETNPRFQPLKASLESELPAFLQKVGAGDTLLVYFSGHGFRAADGKLYLAPLDCNLEKLAETALGVQWLKEQIAACKADFKLLVIDSCHAGSQKGHDEAAVPAGELGEPFKGLDGVVTLASCMEKEKSQIWKAKRQSLFSFWLNQGLRGHADANGDGIVDVDELYKYVHRRVTATAKAEFPLVQTPVRSVLTGRPGVPAVVRLAPQDLNQVVADMAEVLACLLQERRFKKVAVLEFSNQNANLDETLGSNFGLLGRLCAERLETRLVDVAEDNFRVVNRRQLQAALSGQQFALADLGSAERLQRLAGQVGGMSVVALGTFCNRVHRVVAIRCRLIEADTSDEVAALGGTAALTESEWAMLGRSVAVSPADYQPQVPPPGQQAPPIGQQVIQRLDQKAQGEHPLKDAKFPLRVQVVVDNKPRQPVFVGNDCYVPVRKGERYELWVENLTGKKVMLRLLVDGLNTLPEREKTKGVEQWAVASRVSLEDARPWVLDPAVAKVNAIRGFVTETGARGKLREFVVVDDQDSVAARQKFTDQLGLITAAFYEGTSGTRVATGFGQERQEDLRERGDVDLGNLLAVLTIHYAEPEAVAKLPRK